MLARAARAGSACAVAALLLPSSGGAGAAEPALLDAPGSWTLARLGADALRFEERVDRPIQAKTLAFRLPEKAKQGEGGWYTIRLRATVVLRADAAAPGTLAVSAATNGRPAALVLFDVQRRGGRLVVTSDSLGEITGRVVESSAATVHEISFENFLQNQGVRPGLNTLSFKVNQNVFPLFRSVDVLPESGIVISRIGPSAPRLSLLVADRDIRAGERFSVAWTLRSEGKKPPTARVRVSFDPTLVELIGQEQQLRRWSPASDRVRGTFVFRSLREGTAPVSVEAVSGLRRPAIETVLRIGPRQSSLSTQSIVAVASAALLILAIAIGIRRRRTVAG